MVSESSRPTRRELLRGAGWLAASGIAGRVIFEGGLYAADLLKPTNGDWIRFGYDLHNTRFNPYEKTIGPDNVGRLKIKWQFETLDAEMVHTTPAIIGDTLCFGAGAYYYALESATGKLKWKFEVEGGGVSSSCQFENGRIYFGSRLADVYCVDATTGKQVWKCTALRAEKPMSASMQYSPVVFNGKVLVGHSGSQAKIACLDAGTGALRWSFRATPEVPLDWKTGGGSLWTSGAIDEQQNAVINVTGNPQVWMPTSMLYTDSILAHDISTGELLWYYQDRGRDSEDLDFSCNPMIFDAAGGRGKIRQCVAAGSKASLVCLNRYTGELYWRIPMPVDGLTLNSTAVAYNRIFMVYSVMPHFASPDPIPAITAAVNGYSGEIDWEVVGKNTSHAPPAVANGIFYQGLAGEMHYAGDVTAKSPHVPRAVSCPSVAGASACGLLQEPATRQGKVQALDVETGYKLWEVSVPSNVRGGVAISNGALYASNGAGAGGPGNFASLPKVPYYVYCFTIDGK